MAGARCPFEKPILSGQCGCRHAVREAIGERIQVGCSSAIALNNCHLLLELLKENSRFALKVTDSWERLPFGKQMRVMLGGLQGLNLVVHDECDRLPENIHALVREAQSRYGALERLPFQKIIKSVTAYRPVRGRRH